MSDPTQTAGQEAPPVIPSGDEIYAAIMGKIEPELLPGAVEALTDKYKNESPAEAAARKARYDKAFAEYDKQYAAYMAMLEEKVKSYQRHAMQSVEAKARMREEEEMTQLESAITSA